MVVINSRSKKKRREKRNCRSDEPGVFVEFLSYRRVEVSRRRSRDGSRVLFFLASDRYQTRQLSIQGREMESSERNSSQSETRLQSNQKRIKVVESGWWWWWWWRLVSRTIKKYAPRGRLRPLNCRPTCFINADRGISTIKLSLIPK